jgi:Uma2 family endonuclease
MSTARQFQPIPAQDYLKGEQTAKRKHEFVNGVVYAMAGGTVQHNRIASNAAVVVGSQLRGQKCQVFNSDMKVRVRTSQGTRFYYPDLSVVCQPNADTESFHDSPVVIVEVITESTRRIDEYEKRDAYLSMASLFVYILIEQSSSAALVYRRIDSGFDREVYAGLDAIIPLPEIACELALKDLYENVEFTPTVADDEDDES